ncbi:MAG: RNA-binding cell elongation regulator Jag/EloR [Emergencia sp.]
MDFSEKWGTDVETAVNLALAELKLTIDEVDVTVLEEPSRGFFGIGSKLALVRVEKKKPEPEPEPAAPVKPAKADRPERHEGKKQDQKKSRRSEKKPEKKGDKADRSEKAEKESKPESPSRLSAEAENLNLSPVENHAALDFLKEVTEQMGLDIEISAKANEDTVFLNIQGKDSGTIIGKRGQTLDAIQYLTSLVVNKDNDNYIRVVVDAENYRAKREKTLEKLANRLADKVVKTRRSVRLEPMNPYERKVIHATLQNNPRVTTRSEGQDPYRRVIIELK